MMAFGSSLTCDVMSACQEDPKYVRFSTESYVNVYRPFGIFPDKIQKISHLADLARLKRVSRYNRKGYLPPSYWS